MTMVWCIFGKGCSFAAASLTWGGMCRKPTILAIGKKKYGSWGKGWLATGSGRVLAYDHCNLFNKSKDVGVYIYIYTYCFGVVNNT